jgi:hypothetical protein
MLDRGRSPASAAGMHGSGGGDESRPQVWLLFVALDCVLGLMRKKERNFTLFTLVVSMLPISMITIGGWEKTSLMQK